MKEKLERYKDVGRPRCSKRCCEDSEYIVRRYEEEGLTSDEIAKECGVSDEHIIHRLHKLGADVRGRGRYKRGKNGDRRRSILWKIDEKELFSSSIKALALKYHFSESSVNYVRKLRKLER